MSGRGRTSWREAGIPCELLALLRWVAWRYVERDGKWTKVPICALTGNAASSTDPSTWCDYGTAAIWAQAHDCGIGIMLGGGLVGIDLDDCIIGATLKPWAMEIVRTVTTYTERSPSGGGLHLLAWGELPAGRRRKGSVEMYDGERYLCVTGNQVAGTPTSVEQRTAELATLHARVFGVTVTPDPAPRTPSPERLSVSDNDLLVRIRRGRGAAKLDELMAGDVTRYGSHSEADLALCSLLAWFTDDAAQIERIVASSGLGRDKWTREHYRRRTIATAMASAAGRRCMDEQRFEAAVARRLGL